MLTIDRREVLLALVAAAASLPLCSSSPWAQSPENTITDELTTALVAGESATTMADLSDDEFLRRFGAVAHLLANLGANPQVAIREASNIGSGATDFDTRGVLPRLISAIDTADLQLGMGQEDFRLINRSAGTALEIAALASRNRGHTPLDRAALRLATTFSQRDRTLLLATSALLAPSNRKSTPLTDIVVPFYSRPLDATVDLLPQNAKSIVQSIRAIGFGNLDTGNASAILEKHIGPTFTELRRDHAAIVAALRNQSLDSRNAASKLAGAKRDLNAISAIGSFVFSSNPNLQRAFSTSMQLADMALGVGLALSTGGLGSLAVAGMLFNGLSAFGSAFGATPKDNIAVAAAIQQLSLQIESIRIEMHNRFNRVDDLQRQTIALLGQVLDEVKTSRAIIVDNLEKLQTQVKEVERIVVGGRRHQIVSDFISSVRTAQVTRNEVGFRLDNYLVEFINYSQLKSNSPVLVSDDGQRLSAIASGVDTIDFMMLAVVKAGNVLGLKSVPQFSNNLVEWSRGVQAYLELQSTSPSNNRDLAKLADEVFADGFRIRESVASYCSHENIALATDKFVAECQRIRGTLIEKCKRIYPERPVAVGRVPHGRVRPASRDDLMDSKKFKYLTRFSDRTDNYDWTIVVVDGDPLEQALERRSLRLDPLGHNPFVVSGRDSVRSYVAARWQPGRTYKFSLKNRRNVEVGLLDRIRIDGQPRQWLGVPNEVHVYDVRNDGADDLQAVLELARNSMDDGEAIRSWLRSVNDEQFDNMAGAYALFMTFVAWRITNKPEIPMHSAIASQMPRSMDDIKKMLEALTESVNTGNVKLALSDSEVGQLDSATRRLRDKVMPSGQTTEWRVERWADFGILISFPSLVDAVMGAWIDTTKAFSRQSSSQLPAPEVGIGVVDRTLLKVVGHLRSRNQS
jgi:hypothetical protein